MVCQPSLTFLFSFPQGYDVSFLITNFHTEQLYKHKLVDFIVQVRGRAKVFSACR